jgi:FKBP-type peptidyl-prolyl cis-trans isomerase (trigger factor)
MRGTSNWAEKAPLTRFFAVTDPKVQELLTQFKELYKTGTIQELMAFYKAHQELKEPMRQIILDMQYLPKKEPPNG